jgi:hypothetical protein
MTLAVAFGSYFIGDLFKIQKYLPSGLLSQAQELSTVPDSSLIITVSITTVAIILFLAVTLIRLKNIEWNDR